MQTKPLFVVKKDSAIHPANTVAPLKIWHKKENAVKWVIEFIIAYDESCKGLSDDGVSREAERYIEEITPMDSADIGI